jgi:hypothetical protein
LYSIFNFGTNFSSYTNHLFASDFEGDISTEADSAYIEAFESINNPMLPAPVVPAENSNSSVREPVARETIPAENSNSTGYSSTSPAENSNSTGNSSTSPAENSNSITNSDNSTSIEGSGSDTGASPDNEPLLPVVQEQKKVRFDDSVEVRTILESKPAEANGPDQNYIAEKPKPLNTLSQEDEAFAVYRKKESSNPNSNNTLPSSAVYEDVYYTEPVPVVTKPDNYIIEAKTGPILKHPTDIGTGSNSEAERANAGLLTPSNNSLASAEAGPSVNANTADVAPENSELDPVKPNPTAAGSSLADKIFKDAQYILETQKLNKSNNVILDNGFPESDSPTQTGPLDKYGDPIDPETAYNTKINKDNYSKHHIELKEEIAAKNIKATLVLPVIDSDDLYSPSKPEPSNQPVASTSNQPVALAHSTLAGSLSTHASANLESVPAEQIRGQKRRLPLEFEEPEQELEGDQRIDKKGKKKAD